jgi:hypothetical protein
MRNEALLALYDTPDPHRPGYTLPGYDRDHARRTAAIVMRVAPEVGISEEWRERLEVAALLHDLGRAGMDPRLFGAVFQAAQDAGMPVRLPELRERYPQVQESDAVELFLELARPALKARGIAITPQVREHVEMRMDFRGRLRRMLERHAGTLRGLGVTVESWMEKVILYYYYPHLMRGEPQVVRRMGMTLVACENFEAFNNARRGRDYYGRPGETMRQAFEALTSFQERGLVEADIVWALAHIAASGELDPVVQEARGNPPDAPLPSDERAFLQALCSTPRSSPQREGQRQSASK